MSLVRARHRFGLLERKPRLVPTVCAGRVPDDAMGVDKIGERIDGPVPRNPHARRVLDEYKNG
jgi:hypothetical protein